MLDIAHHMYVMISRNDIYRIQMTDHQIDIAYSRPYQALSQRKQRKHTVGNNQNRLYTKNHLYKHANMVLRGRSGSWFTGDSRTRQLL